MAPDRVLHATVALATVMVLVLNAAPQSETSAANLLASLFLAGIVVTDAVTRKIPNALILAAILLGLAVNDHNNSIPGVVTSLAGISVGLLLLFPFHLTGGMGAGDVKALAALGAFTGPAIILQIFLYTALVGGVLSLLHFLCTSNLRQQARAGLKALRAFPYTVNFRRPTSEENREQQRLPYAAAIALSFSAFRHWGPIVPLPW